MAWRVVCRVADVPADRGWPVRIDERYLAVFRLDDGFVAVDNVCRHVGNPLDDGVVESGCVTCPWHGWRYDLRTGDHLTFFGRRPGLGVYRVRVEGSQVLVDLPD